MFPLLLLAVTALLVLAALCRPAGVTLARRGRAPRRRPFQAAFGLRRPRAV